MARLVWDWPVRIIHWSLVICVAGAWLTQNLERDLFRWHTWFGYAVTVLVVTRILWGLVGTRHARYASFVRSPAAAWRYLAGLFRGDAAKVAGHNPLGGWMVLLLLALLLAQAVTGLFANDQILNTGPLYGHVSSGLSDRLTSVHKQVFDILLGAIALHVIAAFAYLVFRRENLIGSMFTGRKPEASVPEAEAITGSRAALAALIAGLTAGALAWLVRSAPEAGLGFY